MVLRRVNGKRFSGSQKKREMIEGGQKKVAPKNQMYNEKVHPKQKMRTYLLPDENQKKGGEIKTGGKNRGGHEVGEAMGVSPRLTEGKGDFERAWGQTKIAASTVRQKADRKTVSINQKGKGGAQYSCYGSFGTNEGEVNRTVPTN